MKNPLASRTSGPSLPAVVQTAVKSGYIIQTGLCLHPPNVAGFFFSP